jgi:hypothetical protein
MEICQRHGLVIFDVTIAFHSARCATGDQNRQVRVVMDIGIADAAAVKIKRVVEQRAVSFRRRF